MQAMLTAWLQKVSSALQPAAHVNKPCQQPHSTLDDVKWMMRINFGHVLQGEQVFITYGQQSNDKLLQYYGFVEPKNPADVYVIPDMLDALRSLPYLTITEDRVKSVQQAGLVASLQQVWAALLLVIACSCMHLPYLYFV